MRITAATRANYADLASGARTSIENLRLLGLHVCEKNPAATLGEASRAFFLGKLPPPQLTTAADVALNESRYPV